MHDDHYAASTGMRPRGDLLDFQPPPPPKKKSLKEDLHGMLHEECRMLKINSNVHNGFLNSTFEVWRTVFIEFETGVLAILQMVQNQNNPVPNLKHLIQIQNRSFNPEWPEHWNTWEGISNPFQIRNNFSNSKGMFWIQHVLFYFYIFINFFYATHLPYKVLHTSNPPFWILLWNFTCLYVLLSPSGGLQPV